ncbi:MAG: Bax inhibitor-1/YccA family protein [Anaerolineae bacterium]|nr:Bax inhibitor-1/YccA family protein [Anaerolineae bacterium]
MDIYRPQATVGVLGERVDFRAVMKEVYLWMTVGLITSAVIALVFAVTGLTAALGPLLFVVMIAQLGLVFYLSLRIMKMGAQRATNVFLLYAALNGISLSTVFYFADLSDIYLALFATGAMFGAMSIIGYTTDVDLTRFRGIFMMALIGLVIASVVNIFFASEALYWMVTYGGVLIFTALTAYDTQWIKRNAQTLEMQGVGSGAALVRRVAIIGALKLYLDFINLFLYILRIVSDR